MGQSQSLFYPDNPKRRDRAQQLASDCQYLTDEYNNTRRDFESQLGPGYLPRVQRLLEVFGWKTLDELDAAIQQRASGQALKDWNEVKSKYDRTSGVDQALMAIIGILAIAGVSISTIDVLAGGFAFALEGAAVVGDVALMLGGIGAIFDIVEGANLRSKLRDAISKLFTARIKCKMLVTRIQNLAAWLPQLETIFQALESAGTSPDQIIDLLKNSGLVQSLQQELKPETYYKAAQELNAMDRDRGAWTNEDPNWESVATALDTAESSESNGMAFYASSEAVPLEIVADNTMPPPPPYEQSVRVVLTNATDAPGPLQNPLHLSLHSFLDPLSANVHIHTDDGHLLGIDGQGMVVEAAKDKVHWTVSFAEESDVPRFGPGANPDLSDVELPVLLSNQGAFIGYDGRMVPGREQAAVYIARYLRD